ncbi:delta-aminolevulinic acid dehydratase, chloroplastic isoform X1 [Elaeis guineensis]|uniref:Delta-aminolevulinic acid dehydratase n=2 Tax=Elaeis guineensis var. tenera TaxID=51953 RepID=A0A6J0PSK9_ELAGV|nr:delta-aminolevulinic acid dehydratase, chloroplastic isoform X2 [Elaeis guineensis]
MTHAKVLRWLRTVVVALYIFCLLSQWEGRVISAWLPIICGSSFLLSEYLHPTYRPIFSRLSPSPSNAAAALVHLPLCLPHASDNNTSGIRLINLVMVTMTSVTLGDVRVVRSVDVQSYVGLKPSTARKSVSLLRRTETRPLMVVRASKEGDISVKSSGLSIEESEAAAVAGNFPDPPPPWRPSAPKGTPNVKPLPLTRRPRRNRKSPTLRDAFQETNLSASNLVLPLFIHEGEEDVPIGAMPGCYRLGWRHGLLEEVYKARDVGVNSIVLFPKIPDALKSQAGDEAFNDNGLVPRAIRLLKDKYPDIVIYTDVALDPYSSDGHDGIVREDGVIMNDETVHQLCKQAVSQARAGADVVSPSDMMDGRVSAIRAALDAEGFQEVSIMSYTAKYASSFYGPFREALDSNPRFGDKKTYQMNPANYREALVETEADEVEGADILLVKPAMPYLDVVRLLRDNSALPIAAYQVSGEYSMIKAGGALKMVDEEKVMMESLLCIRRAGADIILTYFARQAASVLCGMKSK